MDNNKPKTEELKAVDVALVEQPVLVPVEEAKTETKPKPKATGPSPRTLKKQIKELNIELAAAMETADAQRQKAEHYFQESMKLKEKMNDDRALASATLNTVRAQIDNLSRVVALLELNGGK